MSTTVRRRRRRATGETPRGRSRRRGSQSRRRRGALAWTHSWQIQAFVVAGVAFAIVVIALVLGHPHPSQVTP